MVDCPRRCVAISIISERALANVAIAPCVKQFVMKVPKFSVLGDLYWPSRPKYDRLAHDAVRRSTWPLHQIKSTGAFG